HGDRQGRHRDQGHQAGDVVAAPVRPLHGPHDRRHEDRVQRAAATSSQMVFGSVFAALKALAAADIEPPRIAPNRKLRTKPSSREIIDPAAITALARSSAELLEGAPWRRWRGTWWTRRA